MFRSLHLTSLLVALVAILAGSGAARAQVVTTNPKPLKEDSQNIAIYFHANKGNKGLQGLPKSTPVYMHTGLITSASTSDTDWQYASEWNVNDDKYKMTYIASNLYRIDIGTIQDFYGCPQSVQIKKLAFVFRNADGSLTGKEEDGGDIYIDVESAGLRVALSSSVTGALITPDNATVKFTVSSTLPARLSLAINGVEIGAEDNSTLFSMDYTFTETGSYNVYANAELDGNRVSTSRRYAFTLASPKADYPGGKPVMGTLANPDGSLTFCIAAPGKQSMFLMGSWNDYASTEDHLMNYQDYEGIRYFWITKSGLDTSSPLLYYFLADGQTSVGDPYARLILDPQNDRSIPASVFPGMPAYPTGKVRDVCIAVYYPPYFDNFEWTDSGFTIPSKSNLMIYELLIRDFTGTEGQARGNGTVRKAIEKLPYLKELGINVIELLPVNEFNGNNSWGYNPNFYFAPDKAYGTPADYKELIDKAHSMGIAVVLDMVFNQTDWQHPWYRLYPVDANPMYNATAPHAYSVLNDWNQGHPLVRQQWKDVVKFWMEEYHVDGFRFDLVKGLGDNDSYANNGDAATNAYNESRIRNMREIQLAMLAVKPDCIFINENLAQTKEENAMAAYGQLNWANVNNSGCQFAMGYESDSSLNRFYAPDDGGRTWGSTVSYLESHDEQRLAYKQKEYGVAAVKNNEEVALLRLGSAAAQMIMAPGSHMIWQFSELGNATNTKNANGGNNVDPKPVYWDYYNEPARRGLYDSYASMIRLKLANSDLFTQNASTTINCSGWSNGRMLRSTLGNRDIITLINPLTDAALTMDVAFNSGAPDSYYVASCSYGTSPTIDIAGGKVTVPANSYVVLASASVENGVESVVSDSAATVLSTEWYTLSGMRLSAPAAGPCIKVDRMTDGTLHTSKILSR